MGNDLELLTESEIRKLARLMGRRGGLVKSEKKAAAARKNGKLGKDFGKLGGRPKTLK